MILVNRVDKSILWKLESPQEARAKSDADFLKAHGLEVEDVSWADCGEINGALVTEFSVLPKALHKVKSPPTRRVCAQEGCQYLAETSSPFCEIKHYNNEPVQGRKDDGEKQRYDLIPFNALAQVVGVLTYGAKKYAPEGWRKVDGWRWRYLGAALRHLTSYARGEKVDPESGHAHLAHALCCLMFIAELDT